CRSTSTVPRQTSSPAATASRWRPDRSDGAGCHQPKGRALVHVLHNLRLDNPSTVLGHVRNLLGIDLLDHPDLDGSATRTAVRTRLVVNREVLGVLTSCLVPFGLSKLPCVINTRVELVANTDRGRRLLAEPLGVVDLEMHPVHLPSESVHGASKVLPVLMNRLIEHIVGPDDCSVV